MPDIADGITQFEPAEIRQGFYVVSSKSSNRIWLGNSLREAAANVDDVISKHLDDGDAWWIDYCLGPDPQGKMAWMGTNQATVIFEIQTILRLMGEN